MKRTKLATLPSLCSLVTDGTHDSPRLQENGVPFIKGKHISSGEIDFTCCDYISQEDHETCIQRVKPQRDDVLLANIGNSIGDVARVKDDREFSIKNLALLRPDPSRVDPKYLYYLAKSQNFQGRLLNLKLGSAQPYVSLENLRSCQFEILPDMEEQQAVGETLCHYDILIENNRRRIKLLEQTARLLYQEWFIRLRFPGHDHVKVVDGVPEGWEKKVAWDVMDVLSGGTPKTEVPDYWGGEIPFFTPKDATDSVYVVGTEKGLTERGLSSCNSQLYPKGTVFITARGTVGKLNLAQTDMGMNQSCYALKARPPLGQFFLFFALQASIEEFRSRAVGAVFDAIIRDTFKLIPFTLPSAKLLKLFEDQVSTVLRQVENLLLQNIKLAQARDLLLPRLMNGEISV